jgi:hypothetical protein
MAQRKDEAVNEQRRRVLILVWLALFMLLFVELDWGLREVRTRQDAMIRILDRQRQHSLSEVLNILEQLTINQGRIVSMMERHNEIVEQQLLECIETTQRLTEERAP